MTNTTALTLSRDVDGHRRVGNLLFASVTRPVPPASSIAARIEMERLLHEDLDWAATWSALLLCSLMQTLPPEDPWRHMAASDGHATRVMPGITVPEGEIGAWTVRGDRFGIADCVDLVTVSDVDTYADPMLCTVAGGISAEAACLLAMAAHSSHAASASLKQLLKSRDDAGVSANEALAEMVDHVSTAICWAAWRRSCYCLDTQFHQCNLLDVARRADAMTGKAPLPVGPAVSMILAGHIDAGTYTELRSFRG